MKNAKDQSKEDSTLDQLVYEIFHPGYIRKWERGKGQVTPEDNAAHLIKNYCQEQVIAELTSLMQHHMSRNSLPPFTTLDIQVLKDRIKALSSETAEELPITEEQDE